MEKLQARLIIEILGRPIENVKQAMIGIIDKMASEKGVKIIDKKIHEPILVQDQKDLFTTFSEIEVELDSVYNFMGVIFAYMPSHIELISPNKIELRNEELNDLANHLTNRLHSYDAITKQMIFERDAVIKRLRVVSPSDFESGKADRQENQSKNVKKQSKNKGIKVKKI